MKILTRLRHHGRTVVHSISAHPTKMMLISASGSDIYLWQSPEAIEDSAARTDLPNPLS
jgi:hypothetical protein